MNPTILKMQQDLEKFRASKMGGQTASSSLPVEQPINTPPIATSTKSAIGQDLERYRANKSSGKLPSSTENKPGLFKEMAKGLVSAPTTLLARPFQAVASVAGASNDEIDKFSQNIPVIGGFIADTPDSLKDVKKDVGRAAQTIALGTGAPIAGGALFGAGTSLEQGNDLLSKETAVSTLTGGAGGKLLQFVGKPLLDVTGKVIGTITPQTIKDISSRGAQAVEKFMKDNQLLGGVASSVSQKIATGLQGVDDTITSSISKAGTATKEVLKSQYPNASLEKHFTEKNRSDIVRPTITNEPRYYKATNVYNDAKSRGVDIEDVATRRGVIHDKIAEGGKYNSQDHADTIRENVYKSGSDITRPALKALEPETQLVPISELRRSMVQQVDNIPDNQITAEAREILRRKVLQRYSDDSAIARQNPNGLSLTALHDARIISGKNGKYKPGASPSDTLTAQQSREEGYVFSKILDSKLPPEFKAMRRSNEEDFLLADYLESLHGKKVPEGITGKATRLFGKAVAATVGGKIGGFPGSILGAQYGDILFNSFQTLPNPIKVRVLESIKTESPQAYKQLIKMIGDKELARLQMLRLPAPKGSSFKEQGPTIFTTPKGKSTTSRQEAVDVASVESGKAKLPKTS